MVLTYANYDGQHHNPNEAHNNPSQWVKNPAAGMGAFPIAPMHGFRIGGIMGMGLLKWNTKMWVHTRKFEESLLLHLVKTVQHRSSDIGEGAIEEILYRDQPHLVGLLNLLSR